VLVVPCRASVDADISVADAWELWNDREKIPRWMKWIDNVTVCSLSSLLSILSNKKLCDFV
jgi:uncharacterized membrane protein